MNKECCNIWQKFNAKDNLIKEYKYWRLLVRSKQARLGACVAIIRRHIEGLSDIKPEEMAEYSKVAKDIEGALGKAFEFDVIHHMIMMFKDKHIHFHIFPRYSRLRKFAGIQWIDDFDPDPFLQKVEPSPQKVLEEIRKKIVENL